jgi:hypothetical protein
VLVLSAASQVGIACATEIAVHITKCTAVSSERTYDMSSSGARWFCGTAPHRNIPIHSLLLKVLPRICAVAYTKAALHQRTLIITLGTATINSPRSVRKYQHEKGHILIDTQKTSRLTDDETEFPKKERKNDGTPLPCSVCSSAGLYACTVFGVRAVLPNLERRSRMARDMSVHESLQETVVVFVRCAWNAGRRTRSLELLWMSGRRAVSSLAVVLHSECQ